MLHTPGFIRKLEHSSCKAAASRPRIEALGLKITWKEAEKRTGKPKSSTQNFSSLRSSSDTVVKHPNWTVRAELDMAGQVTWTPHTARYLQSQCTLV
ncbi:hypothetical protein RRG08_058971 [Elysia crispata]|nr:hypothetical protein RRG08_058971 [Elysia crispata]